MLISRHLKPHWFRQLERLDETVNSNLANFQRDLDAI